jgi:hypothetical protein
MGNRGPQPGGVSFEQLAGQITIEEAIREAQYEFLAETTRDEEEAHCDRCHGREDGPCEEPYGHGAFACPGCKEDAA